MSYLEYVYLKVRCGNSVITDVIEDIVTNTNLQNLLWELFYSQYILIHIQSNLWTKASQRRDGIYGLYRQVVFINNLCSIAVHLNKKNCI